MKKFTEAELSNLRGFFEEFFYLYTSTSAEDSGGLDELHDRALTCAEILGVHNDTWERDE